MSSRLRVATLLGIMLLAMVGGTYLMAQSLWLRNYVDLEMQTARQAVGRTLDGLANELDQLKVTTIDYAVWDDTYQYVVGEAPEFITATFDAQVLTNLRVNLVVITDAAGQVVYSTAVAPSGSELVAVPVSLAQQLAAQGLKFEAGRTGVLLLPTGILFIATQPVLASQGQGPAHGTLIFGRYFDAVEQARLERLTHLAVEWLRADEPLTARALTSLPVALTPVVEAANDEHLIGRAWMPDINGQPALVLEIDTPRPIFRQGQTGLAYFIGLLALFGSFASAMLFVVIDRWLTLRHQQHASETRLQTVVAAAPIFLFATDAAGVVTLLRGRGLDAMRPIDPSQFIGRSVFDANSPLPAPIRADIRRALAGETFSTTLEAMDLAFEMWYSAHRDEQGRITDVIGVGTNITERKAMEMMWNRYAFIVNTSKEFMTLIDQSRTYVAVNDAYCKAHDTARPNIVGKTLAEVWGPARYATHIHDNLDQCFAGHEVHYQAWFEFAALGRRYLDVAYYPYFDGDIVTHVVVVSHDDTEHRQAEEALDRERRLLRTVIDNVPDQIFVRDWAGRFVLSNRSDALAMGVSDPDTLLGKSDADFYPPELAARYQADNRQVMESGLPLINREEPSAAQAGGSPRWILTTKVPLRDGQGQVVGVVGIARDISERKQAEELLRQQSEQLRLLYEASQRLNRTLDLNEIYQAICEFISVIAPNDNLVVSTFDPDARLIICRAFWMENKWLDVNRFPPIPLEAEGKGTQSLVIRTGRSMLINDYQAQQRTAQSVYYVNDQTNEVVTEVPPDEDVARSALIVPLKTGDKVSGVIQVISYRQNAYTENQLKLLEALALHIASAEKNALLYAQVQSELIERRRTEEALQIAHAQNQQLLTSISSILIGISPDDRITHWNEPAAAAFGIDAAHAIGRSFADCDIPWDATEVNQCVSIVRRENRPSQLGSIRYKRPDGKDGFLNITLSPFGGDEFDRPGFLLLAEEITEHKLMELQLVQAQKLEAIGQLAAGIAHEINTPIQYVGDNTRFLQESFFEIVSLLDKYHSLVRAAKVGALGCAQLAEIETAETEVDLDYLTREVPKALYESLGGLARVAEIVRAMREFSHPDIGEKVATNLNKAIENTITVARNEWKYVAELQTDLDADLPRVPCLPGEFNQVILNLLVNAAQSIADVVGDGSNGKGAITVTTRRAGNWAEISIRDTGLGIPEAVRGKIFDPFFTTKEVGKGTGQGLAISYNVIVEKHGGTITFETELWKGTTFFIRLPIVGDALESDRDRVTPEAIYAG